MKKNKILNIRNICLLIFLIIVIISIILVVDYNIKEQERKENNTTNVVKEAYSFLSDLDSSKLVNETQIKIQNDIKDKLTKKGKEHTLDDPLIVTDPYNFNPLSAYVLFKTEDLLSSSVTIKGINNDDITFNYNASTMHYLPIYYLYPNMDNHVIITLSDGKTKDIVITIDEQIEKANVSGYSNEFYTVSGENIMVYDSYGNPRMKLMINSNIEVKELSNGNFIISSEEFGTSYDNRSSILEITPLGEIIHKYNLKNGIHSEVVEDSNLNLYIITTNNENQEVIILLDRVSGETLQEYNINAILNENNLLVDNITLMNDNILISIRNKNTIVSINKNKEINWLIGNYTNWDSSLTKLFLRANTWNTKVPNGISDIYFLNDELYVFENNYDTIMNEEIDCNTYKNKKSYMRSYSINEQYKTYKAKKTYNLNNYSMDNGKVLVTDSIVVSLGNVIADNVDTNNYECNSNTLDSFKTIINKLDNRGKTSYEMILNYETKNVTNYRIISNVDYTLKDGIETFQLVNQKPEDIPDNIVNTYRSSKTKAHELILSDNHLKIDELFDNSKEVYVSFLNPNGSAYKYKYKDENSKQNNYIDISLLTKGKYYIFIIEDNMVYNTGRYIVVKEK